MLIHKYTVHLSRGPEVGGRKRDRRKEGGLMKRRHFIYFYNKMAWFLYTELACTVLALVGNSLVQYYFTPEFYSIWFYSWRTDIDGHSESRRFYRDMTSLVCLTVHPLYGTDMIITTHTRDTEVDMFMAATDALLQYCTVLYSRDCLLYRNKLMCTRENSLLYTYKQYVYFHTRFRTIYTSIQFPRSRCVNNFFSF